MAKQSDSYRYGEKACINGISRAPFHDEAFMNDIVAGLTVGAGSGPLEEWLRGWDAANLRDLFATASRERDSKG